MKSEENERNNNIEERKTNVIMKSWNKQCQWKCENINVAKIVNCNGNESESEKKAMKREMKQIEEMKMKSNNVWKKISKKEASHAMKRERNRRRKYQRKIINKKMKNEEMQ